MSRKRALINFNVPRAGRITTNRLIGAAVTGGIIIAAWNWSSRLPGAAGTYAEKGKFYVMKALGYRMYG